MMKPIDTMKKEELVAHARKLAQENKLLTLELKEAKGSTPSLVSTEGLEFNALGLAFKCKSATEFEVHLLDYDIETGQGIVKEKFLFDRRYQAEYKVKELLHLKVFKGGTK
jgi:hypothetical protein